MQIGEKPKVVGGPVVAHSIPKQHLYVGANDKIQALDCYWGVRVEVRP